MTIPPEAYEAAREAGRHSTNTRDIVDAAAPHIARTERERIAAELRAEAIEHEVEPNTADGYSWALVLRAVADRLLAASPDERTDPE